MSYINSYNNNASYSPAIGLPNPRYWNGNGTQHHQNLSDQTVGWNSWRPFGCGQANKGHAIDLNGNGRYDRGRDGVLVFDTNRDGRYDQRDVSNTNDLMKAAAGNYDFNRDGRVDCSERFRGQVLRNQYGQLDRNRDGRLDTNEIARGGGKVWVDHSRDGRINGCELHSPFRLPGGPFEPRGRRLDSVDPIWGSRTSSNTPWWTRPCVGIGHPPFGGGINPYGGGGGY